MVFVVMIILFEMFSSLTKSLLKNIKVAIILLESADWQMVVRANYNNE